MSDTIFLRYRKAVFATVVLVIVTLLGGCAELDQLTKPRVEGLHKVEGFNNAVLTEGGFGKTGVVSSLADADINTEALQPMLEAAIRKKRSDLLVSSDGRYQLTANVIANDISQREDVLENTVYKWTKRRIKVSYKVIDSTTGEQVWTGIIQTDDEPIASYEIKSKKSKDKVLDAVAAAISKTEQYPYPAAPVFSDVAKRNFEGFALNLPKKK